MVLLRGCSVYAVERSELQRASLIFERLNGVRIKALYIGELLGKHLYLSSSRAQENVHRCIQTDEAGDRLQLVPVPQDEV